MKQSNIIRTFALGVESFFLETKIFPWICVVISLVMVISFCDVNPAFLELVTLVGWYKWLVAIPFVLFYFIQIYLYKYESKNFGVSSQYIKRVIILVTYLSYVSGVFVLIGLIYKFEFLKNVDIYENNRLRLINPNWWLWDITAAALVSYISAKIYLVYNIELVNLLNF